MSDARPTVTELMPVDFDPFATSALEGVLRLTEPQSEIWIAVQMGDAASCAYNQCFSLTLRGTLSEESMRTALRQVVGRHEALRVTIDASGEQQNIAVSFPIDLPVFELSQASPEDRSAEIERFLHAEAMTPFDLTVGPLVRATLVRESPDLHRLIVTAHHIVFDGWSSAVFFDDLARVYSADRHGLKAQLPPAAAYGEFVAREASRTEDPEAREHEDYWADLYSRSIPVLDLPLERPRPVSRTFRGARQELRIESSLYGALKKLGAQNGCTLFVTLLAGFEALLSRLSGQDEFVIGIPMAGQALQENSHLVGHCVNLIPLRCRVDSSASIVDHFKSVKRTFLDAQSHQRVTFGSLVRRLNVPRDPSRTPLVSVTFNIDKIGSPFDFGALALEGIATPKLFHNFEISINAVDSGHDLLIECDYNSDLFDADTIQRWLVYYKRLMEACTLDSTVRVDDLAFLSDAERGQLLVEWNRTGTAYPRERSIHELFEDQVECFPDAIAVEYEERRLTFAELNARANKLAHFLIRLGATPEAMVGICADRSLEMVVGLLGILKAGCAYVPLDPGYPSDRLSLMLDETAAPFLLAQSRLRDRLPQFGGRVIFLDVAAPEFADEGTENPGVGVNASNLAYVMYTSGSTGRPKGTCIEHRSVVRLVRSTNYIELGPKEVLLQYSPISFDASTLEIWGSLLNGGKLLVCPAGQLSLEQLGRVISEGGVSTLWLTAGLFNLMVDEQIGCLRGVRQLLAGGEALSVLHVRRALEAIGSGRLINGYGPTENTTFTCCHVMTSDSGIEQTVPIGRPISNTRVYILDPRMQPVPVGVCGELFIGGDGLAREYLSQPDLTAASFIPDPFSGEAGARMYRTGDWVRYRKDGIIEFIGRRDTQVKIRGYRIELGEIEAGIAGHPAIRQVAVIAREDIPGDKRLVAYFVAADAPAHLVEKLRELIRATMPEYMVPAHFVSLPGLPLTPNGKLDRRALPTPSASGLALGLSAYLAPRNDLEISIATAWEKVLGVQNVGINDNFFDLGGNSLLALKLMVEIEQATGNKIDLGQLFRAPTIAGLVASFGPNAKKNTSVVVPLQPKGDGLPVFCICGVNIYKAFAQSLGTDQPVYGVYVDEEQAIIDQVIRGDKPAVSIERLVDAYYKAIVRFQTRGPYRLAGLSFGGILAMELASKMRKDGVEVELVFLLDAILPQAVHLNWTKWISYQATEILKGNGAEKIHRLLAKFRNDVSKRWSQIGILQRDKSVDDTFTIKQEAAYLVAAQKWQAQKSVCDFKVILFRASDLSMSGPYVELDEDLGWRSYLGDRLFIIDAVGGHRGIIEAPNVAELGRNAQRYLAANSQSGHDVGAAQN